MPFDEPALQPPAVQRYCRQFLQAEPALDLPPAAVLRRLDAQEALYAQLFAPAAQDADHPLPPALVLRALKALVARIEASLGEDDAISEPLLLCLAHFATPSTALSAAAARKHRVVYTLSSLQAPPAAPPTLTLLENRATIAAAGTTGLRTWEAALHLGAYLCRHPHLVRGRRVLELGAGTGYVSILCAKHLGASCVATDGSAEVLAHLPENLGRNGLAAGTLPFGALAWGTPPRDWPPPARQPFDVVLGADITFDERDMPALLATIQACVAANPAATVLIAATERNKATLDAFTRLAAAAFAVDRVPFPVPPKEQQAGPFYSDAVPIHICQLTLQ